MMLTWIHALRSSRVLDDRVPGHALRDQSVVHALLSAKDQVPLEPSPEHLRRCVAQRVQEIMPHQPSVTDAWIDALRRVATPIVALLGLTTCVIAWQWSRATPRVTNLPALVDAANLDDDPDPSVDAPPAVERKAFRTIAHTSDSSLAFTSVMLPPPPSEALSMKRDAEGFIRGVISTLPVRIDEPK